MANIIDALTLTLGLDTTEFTKGQREVNDSWTKTKDTTIKNAKLVDGKNQDLIESFNKLKIETLGCFAALAGAQGIKNFVTTVNQLDSAIGRLAEILGENPQILQAFGNAVERVGGSSTEARASISKLSKEFYDLKISGKALPTESYRAFAATGRTVDTSKGLFGFLNDYAGALKDIKKTDPSGAFFLDQGGGLDAGSVTLMMQYGDALQKYVESLKDLSATDKQIENPRN